MTERQSRIDSAISSAQRLTGLVQKNDYGTANDQKVARDITNIHNQLDALPDSPAKTKVLNAMNTLQDAYALRETNPRVDADTPTTQLNAVIQELKQIAGRRHKTRKSRRKLRKTRRN